MFRVWLCLLLSMPAILAAAPGQAEDSPEWTQCTTRPGYCTWAAHPGQVTGGVI
jgi:hypothetical protein